MGKRLWSALFVYLGFAGSAQALSITLSVPLEITSLSEWESNPYGPPNSLEIGDEGSIHYAFQKDDIVVESLAPGEVTFRVAPWSFQGSFPDASLPGAGSVGPFAVLRIRMTDGAVDTLLVDAVEDDFSFHTLLLTDPSGTAFSASDLLAPAKRLASLDASQLFQASWRLETQPGAIAEGGHPTPEPGGAALLALGLAAVHHCARRPSSRRSRVRSARSLRRHQRQ